MDAASKSYRPKFDWLNQIFNIGGLIALVLVLITAYLLINRPEAEFPEFLKTALLTIVGFHFGGYIAQNRSQRTESES